MSIDGSLRSAIVADGRATSEDKTNQHIIKALYECTNSSIYIISPDYKITFFNKKASENSKFLYGRELKIGETIVAGLREQNEVFSALKKNLEFAFAGTSMVSERELRYPHFSTWIRAEYSPVFENENVVAVCLKIKEINDRKEFEGEIEKRNNSLKEIAWIQSHETRQPVATILGLINILDKKTLTRDNLEIVKMLENTVVKLDKVIRDTIIKANNLGK